MEYEFKQDITGDALATCPSEYELFGVWLTDEVNQLNPQLLEISRAINSLIEKQIKSKEFKHQNYILRMNQYEVELVYGEIAEDLDRVENPSEEDDFTQSYHNLINDTESSSMTGCGLSDFSKLIQEWIEFIS